jgi:hypothetical protein
MENQAKYEDLRRAARAALQRIGGCAQGYAFRLRPG